MDDRARALRNALGCFATGVCVVTTEGQGGPIGLTINSFASVSLDPPLVLWSLDRGSDTMPDFDAAERFCINVLPDDMKAESQRLSRKGDHRLSPDELVAGTGYRVLRRALAHFACDVEARHDGGDHVIFVGRVRDFAYRDHGHPLLYYRGRYRGLAPMEHV